MFERKVLGYLSAMLFIPCAVILTAGQMIPPGPSDTGLGGVNTITGMVLVSSGERLQRSMSLRLQSSTRGDRVVLTDENGNFAFRGLPSGDYTIVIDKEKEYEPYVQAVSVVQMKGFGPQSYNISIRLTPKSAAVAKPGVIDAELAKIPKHALAMYNKAKEFAKNGDRPGAILQLQGAVAEYPEFMLAYNEMGVQYMRLNDLQKSDDALQLALKIDAQAYMPLMNRGIVLVMMKRWADAVPVLREAVKMKKDNAVGHYFLGQAVANLGKFVEAEKELLTAVKLGGDEMKEAHRLLAIIYGSSGDKKGAADELETYLRLAPNTPDADNLRHVILQLKGLEPPTPTPPTKPS